MKRFFFPLVAVACAALVAPMCAQVPDSAPATTAPAPAPAAPPSSGPPPAASSNPAAASGNNFLGKDVPFLDPAGEMLSWDGKHWNVNNNRIFGARFEKYLNAEAETNDADVRYRAIVKSIIDKLSPYHISPGSLDEAFRMLPQASSFEADANLSDALAASVYSVWQARREDTRLVQANDALEQERRAVQWNAQMSMGGTILDPIGPKASGAEQAQWAKQQEMKRTTEMQPYVTRLAEIKALSSANKAKRELSELQTKIEFQALIVQFFFQRRFQHVLMATQFYRAIFGEGDTTLKVGKDTEKLFSSTTGMPPTVSVLDSLAREAMRDAREGVEAYKFLLGQERTGKRHEAAVGSVRRRGIHAGTAHAAPRRQAPSARVHAEGQPARVRTGGEGLHAGGEARARPGTNGQGLRQFQADGRDRNREDRFGHAPRQGEECGRERRPRDAGSLN